MVESWWGLSAQQQRDVFYCSRPAPGEGLEQFIVRLEDEHRRLKIDEEATFRAFEQYVPLDMHADLEAVHRVSAAIVGRGVMRVLWSMVVNQAMVRLEGPVFSTSAAASGPSHVSIFPPPPAPINTPAAGASTVTAHVTHKPRGASAGGSAQTAV